MVDMNSAIFFKFVLSFHVILFICWWILTPWLPTLSSHRMHLRPYNFNQNHMQTNSDSQYHTRTHTLNNSNLMRSRDGNQSRSNSTTSVGNTKHHRNPVQPKIMDLYKIVIIEYRKFYQYGKYPKLCNCNGDQFYVKNDTAAVHEADVVVFTIGTRHIITVAEWRQQYKNRRPSQLWILASRESPQSCTAVKPPVDMVKAYNLSFTYHSRSNFPTPYGWFVKFDSPQNVSINWYAEKSKLIQWTSSHCSLGERRYRRMEFVYALKDYLNITMYGECGDGKFHGDDYVEEVRAHKFALVLENSCCSEYITEKLWNALTIYYTVPVVYGATREEYERIAPPNSFIFIQDFSSLQALADYIIEVGSDELRYNKYHDWRKLGYGEKQNLYNDQIYHCPSICRMSETIKEAQRGKVFQFNENSDVFYGGCRKCDNELNVLLSENRKQGLFSANEVKLK